MRVWRCPCQGQMGSVSSSENHQQTSGTSQIYGTSHQSESTNATSQGIFYRSGSVPVGLYALQRENVFPERPDQPECQYYMKTGDCKFGAMCKFHHPRERLIPIPSCTLSPLGLPLRPVSAALSFFLKCRISTSNSMHISLLYCSLKSLIHALLLQEMQ